MLSVELKPADFRPLQRHHAGCRKRLAIIGYGNIQPFKLRSLVERKADEYAPTHAIECVVRLKWIA